MPHADTDTQIVAFAVEDALATFCSAATTEHTGPDVLSSRLITELGLGAHRLILEYRTLLREVWTALESCPLATPHDEAADALLTAAPDTDDDGPGGRWRHADLVDGAVRSVSDHRAPAAAAVAVAAYRASTGRASAGPNRWRPAIRCARRGTGRRRSTYWCGPGDR